MRHAREPFPGRIARDIVKLQRAQGVTDAQLAEHVGLATGDLRQLLVRGEALTLRDLARAARALGARVEVRLEPRGSSPSAGGGGKNGAARSSPVHDVLRKLRSALSRADHEPLERYTAGELIARVKRDPGPYGARAVPMLAAEVGEGAANLYRFASVAECWTRAEVRKLMGQGLSWSHLVLLAHVSDPQVRATWMRRALRDGLSVRQLEAGVGPRFRGFHTVFKRVRS